jgi:hypothetical protein
MIGKLIRALVGRSMARKHGLSGAAGAAAGLLAPFVVKKSASLIAKGGHRAHGGATSMESALILSGEPTGLKGAFSMLPARRGNRS